MRRAGGFTLLEMLVAIGIFALIGVASYRVLGGVMQTDGRLAARSAELREVNRALWQLQQDIEQLIPRPARGAEGAAQPYLQVAAEAELPLLFTRSGRLNPLGLPRSSMQRVAYRVDHHPGYEDADSDHYQDERWYLLRYTWPMLDGAGNRDDATVQVLLPDIEKMTVEVLTDTGLTAQWPPAQQQQQTEAPIALRLELTHSTRGPIQRWYKVL